MAYASNITSASQNGLAARFSNLISAFRARRAQAKIYRETFRELSSLSNRELRDLGLGRSEIRRVAYQAAYKA